MISRAQAKKLYAKVLEENDYKAMRDLCKSDLFFLLYIGCKRKDMDKDWLYDRCREVEANPDGYLDLWSREHYKSTIITYGKTIQDILVNPNTTVGIFSHTRGVAKSFLKQIKTELEVNAFLKSLFPEILYANPIKESPRWSMDLGITVKRSQNPKESTIEAWGVTDGQPTGMHYSLLVYDDLVTIESVGTPDQIAKTTEAWAVSLNLGAAGGKRRMIGTYYHFNDTYREVVKRGAAIPRIKPATVDGTVNGEPVFLSRKVLDEKRMAMGPYVFSCQMLLNPVADTAQGFKADWLRYYPREAPAVLNKYILVDPAGSKKKNSDYTVMHVIGLGVDQNYYWVDGIRDRLNLTERGAALFSLVRKHRMSGFQCVGYEQYGMQADIEHIRDLMDRENYRFDIRPMGGQVPKNDRIRRLVPVFEKGRFYFPRRLLTEDLEGKAHDLVEEFINDEFLAFPVAVHDDAFDCMARIVDPDLGAQFPLHKEGIYTMLPQKAKNTFDPFKDL